MTTRSGARLAVSLCLLTLVLVAASALLWALNHEDLDVLADNSYFNLASIAVTFAVLGALIARRQPSNAVGWLFCGAGLGSSLTIAANSYAVFALRTHPDLPGGVAASWLVSMLWLPSLSAMIFLLLVFPDGRLPSPRARLIKRTALLGIALAELFFIAHPHSNDPVNGVRADNPFGMASLKVAAEVAMAASLLLSVVSVLGALGVLVGRFRRSHGRERQQLKWFTYAAAVGVAFAIATTSVVHAGMLFAAIQALIVGPLLAFAVGVAMLRHQLYDIDVVINRTLVYAALTATLAGAYLGSVLLLQLALDQVTSGSSLAVAVSTLAVAALFRPARARIQAAVDRRFYRRKYDAARTLEEFSSRLRDQVDLDALGGELRAVVADTMQPAHVSLWLRQARR
jgi:hypothetical protein